MLPSPPSPPPTSCPATPLTPTPTLATPTLTTARGRLRLTPPWFTPPVLSATPTLSEPMPSPTPERPTPSPTLLSASPTPPTLASAPTSRVPRCRAAGRGKPTPPSSTLPVPCRTPTESSPTPASTAPTPSTPLPTLVPDSLTLPTLASAPTMLVPLFLANCLNQSDHQYIWPT